MDEVAQWTQRIDIIEMQKIRSQDDQINSTTTTIQINSTRDT